MKHCGISGYMDTEFKKKNEENWKKLGRKRCERVKERKEKSRNKRKLKNENNEENQKSNKCLDKTVVVTYVGF